MPVPIRSNNPTVKSALYMFPISILSSAALFMRSALCSPHEDEDNFFKTCRETAPDAHTFTFQTAPAQVVLLATAVAMARTAGEYRECVCNV